MSLSSMLSVETSLESVLRLRSDDGGDATLDSSLANLLLLVGEVRGLPNCSKSPPDSRRRVPGRVDGEWVVLLCVTEVLRFRFPLVGVASLFVFWFGGLSGEFTEVEKACWILAEPLWICYSQDIHIPPSLLKSFVVTR